MSAGENDVFYISGPIRGMEEPELMFQEAADYVIRGLGSQAVNPFMVEPWDHNGVHTHCPGNTNPGTSGHDEGCHLRTDIAALVHCTDLVLLPGWQLSVGSRLELSVALHCGIEVWRYTPKPMRQSLTLVTS